MKLGKYIMKWKECIKKQWNKTSKEEGDSYRKTMKHILLLFFIAMFGFSFLSRAADSILVAKVSVKKPQSYKLNFKLNGTGTIKEKETTKIKILQGLRVDEVFVLVGTKIKEGDLLFSYDMKELQSLYETKKAAIDKNKIEQDKLSLNDSQSALKSAELAKKYAQQGIEEAEENLEAAKQSIDDEMEEAYQKAKDAYEKLKSERDNDISSAKEVLKKAQKELKDLENKKNSVKVEENLENKNTKDTVDAASIDQQIEAAKQAVEAAQEDLDSRKEKWNESIESAKNLQKEAKESWEAVQNGTYDYTLGLSNANSALTQAQKSMEEAQLAVESAIENKEKEKESTSLTLKSIQLDIDLASKEVEELKSLLDGEGKVYALEEGTLVLMDIEAGAVTTGTEKISCAVNGVVLEASLDKNQKEKLAIGDAVQVRIGDDKESIKAEISSIEMKETNGAFICEMNLPEGDYTIGGEVSFEWSKDSAQYDKCIPIRALREDGMGQTYVLSVSQKEGILGNELSASRLDVTVIDKDTSTAAVEGAITYEDQIIIGSNKEIAQGDRIRVVEDE
ncbi:hypothetical protein [Candidatus Galacturonibacter soehngenii]|uniref:Biotin/lipoyl-binding protein n=1 Tax=Candidatus Galacturonatibacter soehngenii TaxID=2307010 RepID=A0A7V7QK59_9FIRM|nr:hypothetical protein [Candidatus Galacturonibacter soehngenii]KAB1438132.1 hypothetical protein F7O84_11265 [Candidatus Galacturonibacter soehngenii]